MTDDTGKRQRVESTRSCPLGAPTRGNASTKTKKLLEKALNHPSDEPSVKLHHHSLCHGHQVELTGAGIGEEEEVNGHLAVVKRHQIFVDDLEGRHRLY